jgi:hypothetical protein
MQAYAAPMAVVARKERTQKKQVHPKASRKGEPNAGREKSRDCKLTYLEFIQIKESPHPGLSRLVSRFVPRRPRYGWWQTVVPAEYSQ